MTEGSLTATRTFKKSSSSDEDVPATPKRPRTAEDFYLFCKLVLEYEGYDNQKAKEELRDKAGSPIGSTGSGDSVKSESSSSVRDDRKSSDDTGTSDDDSFDLVTCYCTKPFAGRPMIECSQCLTWIHLSCAKIKRSNIPEVFICVKCTNKGKHSPPEDSSPSPSPQNYRHKKRLSV